MNEMVKINNTEMTVRELFGKRVVTFNEIDTVHDLPEGTTRKAFNRNRKYFIKDSDYYVIKKKDLETLDISEMGISCPSDFQDVNPRGTTFVTEFGYFMLTNSLTGDRAWNVQRKLVDVYFRAKEMSSDVTEKLRKQAAEIGKLKAELYILSKNSGKSVQNSRWVSKAFKKIDALVDHYKETKSKKCNRGWVMNDIYTLMEHEGGVDVEAIVERYRNEYGDPKFEINAISMYEESRNCFDMVVDRLLDSLGIEDPSTHTIFDEDWRKG